MSRRGAQNFWLYIRERRKDRRISAWSYRESIGKSDQSGASTFLDFENGAKDISSRHPRAVKAAIEGKRSLNWQIKSWAEDCQRAYFLLFELIEENPQLPIWVWKAVCKQAWPNADFDIIIKGTCRLIHEINGCEIDATLWAYFRKVKL